LHEHFELSDSVIDPTMLPLKPTLEFLDREIFFAYGTSTAGSSHNFISHFKNLWDQSGQGIDYVFCSSWDKVLTDVTPSASGLNLYFETGNLYVGDIFQILSSDLTSLNTGGLTWEYFVPTGATLASSSNTGNTLTLMPGCNNVIDPEID